MGRGEVQLTARQWSDRRVGRNTWSVTLTSRLVEEPGDDGWCRWLPAALVEGGPASPLKQGESVVAVEAVGETGAVVEHGREANDGLARLRPAEGLPAQGGARPCMGGRI